jgi:hypothetical protein
VHCRQVGDAIGSSARIRNASDPRRLLASAIALALFVAALKLQVEFAGGIDIRHSVEPQDLSDCRAPLLLVPVSGGKSHCELLRGKSNALARLCLAYGLEIVQRLNFVKSYDAVSLEGGMSRNLKVDRARATR